MKRRDLMMAAATITATASPLISAVAFPDEGEDLMVQMVDRLFALREAYQVAPTQDGNLDSPEHLALDAEIRNLECEIEARPIHTCRDVGAYARYLAADAEFFEIDPGSFTKFIAWGEDKRSAI